MSPKLVFSVSGHGFGHAVRAAALLAALRERAPGIELHVRGEAPDWIFRDRDPETRCTHTSIDPGVVQTSGLDLDLPATLAAHEDFVANWDATVEREARFLLETGADLAIADIPPLAFAAAKRAGIPAIGVANFSWDWIFAAYAGAEPRWRGIVARYREAYAGAEALYRLPLYGDLGAFPKIVDTPLLVHRSPRNIAACRARLGLDPNERRRLVLVSFGGFGASGLTAAAGAELSQYLFTTHRR